MNKKIYFTRHGETFWNVANKICGATDIGLTDKGHEQAEELGNLIKSKLDSGDIVIDEIIASPLSRAETVKFSRWISATLSNPMMVENLCSV